MSEYTLSRTDPNLEYAVEQFEAAMKTKLDIQQKKGYRGWEDCSIEHLQNLLAEHIEKGDMVDVANFACMIWWRENND